MFLKELSFFNVSILSWTCCNKAFCPRLSITPLIKINDDLIWLNSIANLPHLTNQQHSIQMIIVYIYLVLCSLSLPSLGKLIKSHSFKYYVYLYDSQIFISFAQASRWHT